MPSSSNALQGADWTRWVVDSGAVEGDWVGLKQGQRVLIKHLPAGEWRRGAAFAATAATEAHTGRLQPQLGSVSDRPDVRASQSWQQATSRILPLAVVGWQMPSERARALCNSLRRLVPNTRQAL
jgi:hypothetical protein